MKISLEWISQYLPDQGVAPLGADAAASALTAGGLPVESITSAAGTSVLDVEVTSNRGDCLSHLGVARELAALLNRPLAEPDISAPECDPPAAAALGVRIENLELCPQYTARLIRGVKIGPSPAWLTRRLEAVGLRPINNVVDVTNYVMFELGQPLHAFDFARVGGGQIVVRTARPGESIVSIDARKRELSSPMLVIADANRPLAIAGIMGGSESEVASGTSDVLLESARFDPLSVRRTARALALHSDSSYRFERGIDPNLPQRASLRAAQLILQTAGGRLAKGVVIAGAAVPGPQTLSLRLPRLRKILGVELPADQVLAALGRLGLSPTIRDQAIEVRVPSFRLDLRQEIDLVEEAARVLGYDRIPTRPDISIQLARPDADATAVQAICQTLAAAGYFEAVTFSFVSDALRTDFGVSGLRADASVRKADASLRPSLLPGLLESVRLNQTSGTDGARLFEIGAIFSADNGRIDERRALAAVGEADLRDIRGVVEAVLARLDARRAVSVRPARREGFSGGSGGEIVWGQQVVGFLGRIDSRVGEKLSLRESVVAAELDLAALLDGSRPVPQLAALPRFPAVRRDVSLVLAQDVPYSRIEALVSELKMEFLEGVEFVTTYRGKPLDKGTKSVTLTLVFRRPQATLTSEEVEASVSRCVAAARDRLGATLRV